MPALIPVDNFLGIALIGLVLSTIVYGITCLLVFSYYTKYSSRDGLFLKTFVAALMTLDTFHLALLVMFVYHYSVTNFGDYVSLQRSTWTVVVQALVGGIVQVLVEMFFAYRLYNLAGKKIIFLIIIAILCLAKLTTTIGFTVIGLGLDAFSLAGKLQAWSISSLALAIACDTVIAVFLIYYLRKGSYIGFKGTHRAINLLITYALNTCLLTSIFNIVDVIMWIKSDTPMLYALFYFILVRLYSCSFMSTLNSRDTVRKEMENRELFTMSQFAAAPATQSQNGTLKLATGSSDLSSAAWDVTQSKV
ncbi:hypothetical protein DFH07DRAFT_575439 [Mycena maculata]|uniref:DUF6534 domain-containing protein n=1 Tax=Mycena maculata TaxID=230809 RepID=A0AAD7IP93_9AGAR|nr:hypothetical protein DFH07DRAFT_575439 [Mycena maculata]